MAAKVGASLHNISEPITQSYKKCNVRPTDHVVIVPQEHPVQPLILVLRSNFIYGLEIA